MSYLSASAAGSRLSLSRAMHKTNGESNGTGGAGGSEQPTTFDGAASLGNRRPAAAQPSTPTMQRQTSSKFELASRTPPPQPPAFRSGPQSMSMRQSAGDNPPASSGGAPPSVPPFKKEEGGGSTGSPMHAAFMSRPPPSPAVTTGAAPASTGSSGGGPPPVPAFTKKPEGGSPHPAFASAAPPKEGGSSHPAFSAMAPKAPTTTSSTSSPASSPTVSTAKVHPAFAAPPPKPVEDKEVESPSQILREKPPPPPISEFRTSGLSPEETLDVSNNEEWGAEEDVFAEADSEENLQFKPDTIHQPRPVINGGTLEKLVERITYEKYPDPDFVAAFLLTYRSFTTPPELLAFLIQRWDIPAPKGANEAQLAEFTKSVLDPVRLRVFNVLNTWVKSHFYDFAEDRSLVDTILDFISDKMMATKESAAVQLKRIVYRKLEGNDGETEIMHSGTPPRPILPTVTGALTLLDIDPLEVARQLTLIEYNLYKSIMPRECLGQVWTKPATRNEKAPHIMAMISRFNQVSRFFATEIVKEPDMRRRADILNHIILVAVGCEKLNNYNAMMEIVSSLQCSSIFRLRHTWALLPKQTVKAYEQIQLLMSREKNFKVFRDHLHSVDPPCIPYLGVYLTDLTFIEDANKDYLADSQKLINFDKRRKIAHVIREIQQYQQAPYCLEVVPVIRDYLLSLQFWEENETYDASMKLEPKGMPAPTIRPKKEGGGASGKLASATARFKSMSKGSKESKAASGSQVLARPEPTPTTQTSTPEVEEEDWGELDKVPGYPFGQPDSKDNIQFDVDVSAHLVGVETNNVRPSIRAATLTKLIERLTHENWPDPALVNTFLLTYTTFTTRKEVLDLLAMRFNVPTPLCKDKDLQDRYNTMKATPIRLRVFNVLKNWSGDRYFHDCVGDADFIKSFSQFAETMAGVGMAKPAEALTRALQRQLDGIPENVERRTVGKMPKPYLPKNLVGLPTLTDFHPEEIARQLTLIEHQLFQQVKPWELLRNAWLSSNAEKAAPNILALKARADRIRDWVATEIVSRDSPEDAAAYITHWIKVAEKCLNLNNFNTTVEIITGLLLPDIQKLKLVWGGVSAKNTFNKLKSLMEGDYAKLQDKLHNVQPPCLPFMGAYLHQISELEAKHPDSVDGLINFEKWTLIGGVISEVNQYQNTLFCLEEVGMIQDWISKAEVFSQSRINEESITLLTRGPRSKAKKVSERFPAIAEASVASPRRESVDSFEPEHTPSRAAPVRATSSMKIAKLLGADEQTLAPHLHQSRGSMSGPSSTRTSISVEPRASGSGNGSDIGLDRQAALKFQVMSMFMDDTEFRQSIADLLLKDLRESLNTLHTDMLDIKRALPSGGASAGGRGGKPSGALVARDIICGHFPGRNLSAWTRDDKDGFVYGWDETVTLFTVSEGNNTVLADVRPSVTKPDVAALLRLAKFYSKEMNRASDLKIYVFSPSINEDARALVASKFANNIELVTV